MPYARLTLSCLPRLILRGDPLDSTTLLLIVIVVWGLMLGGTIFFWKRLDPKERKVATAILITLTGGLAVFWAISKPGDDDGDVTPKPIKPPSWEGDADVVDDEIEDLNDKQEALDEKLDAIEEDMARPADPDHDVDAGGDFARELARLHDGSE